MSLHEPRRRGCIGVMAAVVALTVLGAVTNVIVLALLGVTLDAPGLALLGLLTGTWWWGCYEIVMGRRRR